MLKLSNDRNKLLVPSQPWDFKNPTMDAVELAIDMVELMNRENGIGIAYSQIDLPGNYAVFAMTGPENHVLFNPKIVNKSIEVYTQDEACLSYKGLSIPVERNREVRIRFQGADGKTYTKTFKNLTARMIQHEIDHIEGRPFWHNTSKLKFDMARRKAYNKGIDFSSLTYRGKYVTDSESS